MSLATVAAIICRSVYQTQQVSGIVEIQMRTFLLKVVWWLDTPSVIDKFQHPPNHIHHLHSDKIWSCQDLPSWPQFYAWTFLGMVGMLAFIKYFCRNCQLFSQMHCCLMEGQLFGQPQKRPQIPPKFGMSWPLAENRIMQHTLFNAFVWRFLQVKIQKLPEGGKYLYTNCHDKRRACSSAKIKCV